MEKRLHLHGRGSWRDDWQRITGEPWGENSRERIHPDDFPRVRKEWQAASDTGRFDCTYRVLAANGEYVRVRGRMRSVGSEWVGIIERVPSQDIARHFAPYIVRGGKNALLMGAFLAALGDRLL